MKQAFVCWNPTRETADRVAQCDAIVNEYMEQGYKLTLRQLYYQFVARGLVPNTERSYKNLGSIVSKARLAGMLDWDAIEDRGRQPNTPSEWDSVADLVEAALSQFRLPRWGGQPNYAELWVEKEALAGVLEPIAERYHATLMVNKGYSSSSAMYESAKRLRKRGRRARRVFVFYLGDLDPSGEDMVRDIEERLELFTCGVLDLEVRKVALTIEQVQEYDPPPNPTKLTDSRAGGFVERYGHECWEVDALEPAVLHEVIEAAFDEVVDRKAMDMVIEREESDKMHLRRLVDEMEVAR